MRLQNRFVIESETNQAVLNAIRDVVNAASGQALAIVAHNRLQPNETLETAQARSKERAMRLIAVLEEMGTDSGKLIAVGAGPISPINRSSLQRLELVLLK